MELTNKQKVEIFDKLVRHGKTMVSGKCVESMFLDDKIVNEIKSHVAYFLLVVESETKKFEELRLIEGERK